MVDQEGRDLCLVLQLLLKKQLAHLLWITLWVTLLCFFSLPLLFIPLILFNGFCFTTRLIHFLSEEGTKVLFFPPLWEKLSRRMKKGEGYELLLQYHLTEHPGLLYNLARTELEREEKEKARQALQKALYLEPKHPLFLKLQQSLDA